MPCSNSSGGFWGNVKGSFLKEVSAVWVSSLYVNALHIALSYSNNLLAK